MYLEEKEKANVEIITQTFPTVTSHDVCTQFSHALIIAFHVL